MTLAWATWLWSMGKATLEPMQPFRARVQNGRLVLDEPTDLPEGKLVELVPIDESLAGGSDHLDGEERAALHASIAEGVEDFQKGDMEDAFDLLARLKARREGPDRQARGPSGRTSKQLVASEPPLCAVPLRT
jgi:hypothetical protein